MVENTTDVTRLAYAALRALKERVETVCFVTGHGETFARRRRTSTTARRNSEGP